MFLHWNPSSLGFGGMCERDPYIVLELIYLVCVCFSDQTLSVIKMVVCLTLIDICKVGFD